MPIVGAQGVNSNSNLGAYISYNGFTFVSPRFRSRIELVPEPSMDGRTTLCNTYRLTVRAWLTDDPEQYRAMINTSAARGSIGAMKSDQFNARSVLQWARSRLAISGGTLIIRGGGFDITVNGGSPNSQFDVRWGPKTISLQMDPVANGMVWQVEWVCEFSIPECPLLTPGGHTDQTAKDANTADVSYIQFPFGAQGVAEGFVYDIAYRIDRHGLTQRVVNGSLSIALARAWATGQGGVNQVLNTADEFRENIIIDVPYGFRRATQDWRLSSDRRFLNFVIVDEELPSENSFPPGIVDMTLEQSVSIGGGKLVPLIAPIVSVSFAGQIEVAKSYPHAQTLDRVLLVIQTRLDYIRKFYQFDLGQAGNPIYITSLNITEAIYGPRRISFVFDFLLINTGATGILGNIVRKTALFQKISTPGANGPNFTNNTPLYDWDTWSESMGRLGPGDMVPVSVWGARGVAGLNYRAQDDQIVGPCDFNGSRAQMDLFFIPTSVVNGGGSLITECPPEDSDYLSWNSYINIGTKNYPIVHSPMEKEVSSTTGPIVDEVYSQSDTAPVSMGYRTPANYPNLGSNATGGSQVKIRLYFMAARIGRQPEIPQINLNKFHLNVQDQTLIQGDSVVRNHRLGKIGDCPLYAAVGYVEYHMVGQKEVADVQQLVQNMNEALVLTPSDPSGNKVGGTN